MAHPSPGPRPRVSWTGREKITLIDRAHAIQGERPDLAGLSLLRAAIRTLPTDRRRRVVSLAQAPWFELGLHNRAEAMKAAKTGGLEYEVIEIKKILIEIRGMLENRA